MPLGLHRHVEKVLLSDIRRRVIPPSKVIEICEEMLEKGYVMDQKEFYSAIDESISAAYKYLEGEEAKAIPNCRWLPNFCRKTSKRC